MRTDKNLCGNMGKHCIGLPDTFRVQRWDARSLVVRTESLENADLEPPSFKEKSVLALSLIICRYLSIPGEVYKELSSILLARDSRSLSDDSDNICVKKAKSVWLVTAFSAGKENPTAGWVSQSMVSHDVSLWKCCIIHVHSTKRCLGRMKTFILSTLKCFVILMTLLNFFHSEKKITIPFEISLELPMITYV